ncbi:MAG: tRNA-modifying protein YgfZ [Actinomycetota bacterium]|nr:tRNA-modifying protein YgfZ [Actinomycetota bacterium]MEA2973309.1 tRNA-modifying protein YgfZ [Actinomycetota bacterium]
MPDTPSISVVASVQSAPRPLDPADLAEDYAALRDGVGVVELPRDFVRVAGPDAMKFLQGQLSQQVDVPVGTSAWSFLLQPQGKVVAFLRLTRSGDEEYILDTDGGWAPAVVERLNRFKLRVKAEIEVLEGWRCLAVRGPGAHEAAPDGVPADWPGWPGVDLIGPVGDVEPPAGVRACSVEAYEIARIEAGVPVMGRELDESTIPAEAGIVDRAASFTKGCYTGQELVARIDSRGGNVPRRLRGVVVGDGHSVPPVGAVVHAGGKDVGVLTSVTPRSERLGAAVALAYVRRAVEPPAEVELRWEGGTAPARVLALPLVP